MGKENAKASSVHFTPSPVVLSTRAHPSPRAAASALSRQQVTRIDFTCHMPILDFEDHCDDGAHADAGSASPVLAGAVPSSMRRVLSTRRVPRMAQLC